MPDEKYEKLARETDLTHDYKNWDLRLANTCALCGFVFGSSSFLGLPAMCPAKLARAFEQMFTEGMKTERRNLIQKLQEMCRMGEQKDDSNMANKAQAMLEWLKSERNLNAE